MTALSITCLYFGYYLMLAEVKISGKLIRQLGMRILDFNDDNIMEFKLGKTKVYFLKEILLLSMGWALMPK